MLTGALIVGGAALWAVGCSVDDQLCPDDTLASDLTDACPYGPPGGPQKKKQLRECPKVTFDETSCAGVSFTATVFPIFTMGKGNCTATGCHGTAADGAKAKGLTFPPDITPADFYKKLSDYKNSQGDPYWGDHAELAWVQCNLLAQPGGGSPMPKPGGLTDPMDQAAVTKWITCGMSLDGAGGSGAGGSGAGGAGGGTGG